MYFNNKDVKKMLHVDSSIHWSICNSKVLDHYNKGDQSTHLYKDFFEAGLKILIYSGNADSVISTEYSTYNI